VTATQALPTGADDHCVLQSWHEWQIDGDRRRITLCLETALEMRPGHPGFEPAKLDALMQDAIGLMRESASPVDSVRIVPARWML
jgi:hypothetical protein